MFSPTTKYLVAYIHIIVIPSQVKMIKKFCMIKSNGTKEERPKLQRLKMAKKYVGYLRQ